MHKRNVASLRNNKFFLLEDEDGVDTRVSGIPVTANDDVDDDDNDDDDDDHCTCVGCLRKDGESLLVPQHANILSTHASGGSRKDV